MRHLAAIGADVGRDQRFGDQVGKAMAAKKIQLAGANRWPEWPQHIRVTVGTYEEMQKFNAALSAVVKEGPMATA